MSRNRFARLGTATVTAVLALSTAAAPAWAAGRGTIEGTFTTDSGAPIADGFVSAWAADGSWFGDAQTDAAGHYVIQNADATDIQMLFQQDSVVQWAHRQVRPEDAETFTVVSGQTLTVDERQLATGTISGRLTDANGDPAAFLSVNARNVDTDQSSYGYAGEDGTYSFTVLPGEYRVSFVHGSGEQWAYQAADANQAHIFAVAAGQTIAVDDTMLPTGTLGGTLTGTDGAPVPETEVDLHRGGQQISTTYTADGAYSFDGLLPGEYQVSFPVNDTVQWLRGKRSSAEATTFTVTAGQNTVADDSVLAPSVVRGRLADTAGTGLEGYHVRVERGLEDGSSESYEATTDAAGDWQVQGPLDGAYLVSFQTPEYGRTQWVPGKGNSRDAEPVTVAAGTTVTVDETWLPGARLKVTATDAATGAPISNFCVWVVDTGDGNACTTGTEATVEDLPAGVFQAQVSPQSPTFYLPSDNVPVTLTAGQSTSVSVPLQQGGNVAVATTDRSTGKPVGDGCVVLRQLGSGGIGDSGDCGDAAGKVTTTPIKPGTYEMYVSAPEPYGDQWVGANGGTGDQRAAKRIVVKAGKTAKAPAVLLDRAGSISGTVTGPDGKPIRDANVSMQAWDYGAGPERATDTDTNGHYTLTGFGPYRWPLSFTAGNLPRQWSGNVPNRFDAKLIPVTSGATSTYNMAMKAGTTISGRVTVGRPFQSWRITAVNVATGDPMGVFDCYDTCDGSYAMRVIGGQRVQIRYDIAYSEGDDTSGWWDHATDRASAKKVAVPVRGRTLNMTLG
jgi:hypothetical protein